jgi:hypothetical protein
MSVFKRKGRGSWKCGVMNWKGQNGIRNESFEKGMPGELEIWGDQLQKETLKFEWVFGQDLPRGFGIVG